MNTFLFHKRTCGDMFYIYENMRLKSVETLSLIVMVQTPSKATVIANNLN